VSVWRRRAFVSLVLIGLVAGAGVVTSTADETGTTAGAADALAPELELLRPLLGPPRVGSYIDSAPGELEMTVQWEPVHDGNAVRFTKTVPEADFSMETLYYWSQLEDRIGFLTISNRGSIARGDVRRDEDGSIVLSGLEASVDHETEFRTTFTVLPDGTVRDVFERFEERRFVRGHVIEYRLHGG